MGLSAVSHVAGVAGFAPHPVGTSVGLEGVALCALRQLAAVKMSAPMGTSGGCGDTGPPVDDGLRGSVWWSQFPMGIVRPLAFSADGAEAATVKILCLVRRT